MAGDYACTMQETPEGFRLTPISFAVLILLTVGWPLQAFLFVSQQLEMMKGIEDPVTEIYLPTMLLQIIAMTLVWVAVKSERVRLSDLGLGRFTRWTILQGLFFFIAANIILTLLQLILLTQSPESFEDFSQLLPRTSTGEAVWILLSVIVAFGEEITFRGYILTRVSRLTGSRTWVGVLVSSFAFASGHLYQGAGNAGVIFIYGLMFAGLYLYTGSLFPGIIAHFVQDSSVLFIRHFQ